MAKTIKVKKQKYRLSHGPFNGESVYLATPGTLPICVGNQRGRYNKFNEWVPA